MQAKEKIPGVSCNDAKLCARGMHFATPEGKEAFLLVWWQNDSLPGSAALSTGKAAGNLFVFPRKERANIPLWARLVEMHVVQSRAPFCLFVF